MNAEYGWADRVMTWLRAVSGLIVVNLLFVAGTLVGLVVLGLMPAAAAATASLTRLRDQDGSGDGSGLVRGFVAEYRRSFRRANLLGIPFAIAAVLVLADQAILPLLPGPAAAALTVFTWVVAAYLVAALAAVLVIEARYRDTLGATLRYAVALPFISPVMTIALLVTLGVIGVSLALLPMLIPLVGVSVPLFVAGWFVDHRLAQLDAGHPRAAHLAATTRTPQTAR